MAEASLVKLAADDCDWILGSITLVQVMAWWRQATSHYLKQGWPTSISPYDITRPQSLNKTIDAAVLLCETPGHQQPRYCYE